MQSPTYDGGDEQLYSDSLEGMPHGGGPEKNHDFVVTSSGKVLQNGVASKPVQGSPLVKKRHHNSQAPLSEEKGGKNVKGMVDAMNGGGRKQQNSISPHRTYPIYSVTGEEATEKRSDDFSDSPYSYVDTPHFHKAVVDRKPKPRGKMKPAGVQIGSKQPGKLYRYLDDSSTDGLELSVDENGIMWDAADSFSANSESYRMSPYGSETAGDVDSSVLMSSRSAAKNRALRAGQDTDDDIDSLDDDGILRPTRDKGSLNNQRGSPSRRAPQLPLGERTNRVLKHFEEEEENTESMERLLKLRNGHGEKSNNTASRNATSVYGTNRRVPRPEVEESPLQRALAVQNRVKSLTFPRTEKKSVTISDTSSSDLVLKPSSVNSGPRPAVRQRKVMNTARSNATPAVEGERPMNTARFNPALALEEERPELLEDFSSSSYASMPPQSNALARGLPAKAAGHTFQADEPSWKTGASQRKTSPQSGLKSEAPPLNNASDKLGPEREPASHRRDVEEQGQRGNEHFPGATYNQQKLNRFEENPQNAGNGAIGTQNQNQGKETDPARAHLNQFALGATPHMTDPGRGYLNQSDPSATPHVTDPERAHLQSNQSATPHMTDPERAHLQSNQSATPHMTDPERSHPSRSDPSVMPYIKDPEKAHLHSDLNATPHTQHSTAADGEPDGTLSTIKRQPSTNMPLTRQASVSADESDVKKLAAVSLNPAQELRARFAQSCSESSVQSSGAESRSISPPQGLPPPPEPVRDDSTDFDLESDLEKYTGPGGEEGGRRGSLAGKSGVRKTVLKKVKGKKPGAKQNQSKAPNAAEDSGSSASDIEAARKNKRREDGRRRRVALFRVFSYLDVRNLCKMALVCKEWQRVSRHPSLWRNVHLKYERVSSKFLVTLSTWCTQMASLTLEGLRSGSRHTSETMDEYQRRIRGCLEGGLEELLKASQDTLKSVSIIACGNVLTDKCMWLLSGYCRLLQKLTYLSDTHPLTAEVMWALGGGCPSITSLIIPPLFPCHNSEGMNNRCLMLIAQFYPDLLEVGVGGRALDITGLVPLVQSCQRLQSLSVDHIKEMGDDSATALCRSGLRQLQQLEICGTAVTANAIKTYYDSCRHLKEIRVFVCINDYFEDIRKKKNKEEYKKIVSSLEELKSQVGLGNILQLRAAPAD